MSVSNLPVARLKNVQRQRHAGKQDTGRGKSGSSRIPRTLSLASLIIDRLREGIMAEIRTVPQRGQKKFGPRVRVGKRQRGPSSTPSDEEGFIYGACTDAKGSVRPDLSKNVREQFQPVNRGQPANARQHVFDLKGLGEKPICAGGYARAYVRRRACSNS